MTRVGTSLEKPLASTDRISRSANDQGLMIDDRNLKGPATKKR